MNENYEEMDEFEHWLDNRFDFDSMIYNVIYKIFEASQDKRTSTIGVIVEKDPEPITAQDFYSLRSNLDKGLKVSFKRDIT